MRRAGLLLLHLLLVAAIPAAGRAQPPSPAPSAAFDAHLAAEVYATALAFMAPRILEPVGIPQLTAWGLHGLTAIDPSLTAELRDGRLILSTPAGLVFAAPAPPPADAVAWGDAAAQMAQAGVLASAALREAGTEGVIRAFFDELFNHLDPYSRYVPPPQAEQDVDKRTGGEAGAGLELARRGAAIVVRDVLADGPAWRAGVRANEQLLSVDGQPTRGQDPATVTDWLAGDDATPVTLVLRGRDGRPREVRLLRGVIPPETVFARHWGGILLLRITGFAADTDTRLAHELERGLAGGGRAVRGVVFDLRGNRGGLLRQAASAVNTVLPSGVIAITAGRNPQASHEWLADSDDLAGGRPVVVVVDGRSASAAEIFAAALQDQGRAVVVGSSTLGKGLVQTIAPLPDGGELFVTWSRVLAPSGWPLQGLGVLPQICTSLGHDALERQLRDLREGKLDMAASLERHDRARAPVPAAEILAIRNDCPAAEGQDSDLDAARSLIGDAGAYRTALLPPPPMPQVGAAAQ